MSLMFINKLCQHFIWNTKNCHNQLKQKQKSRWIARNHDPFYRKLLISYICRLGYVMMSIKVSLFVMSLDDVLGLSYIRKLLSCVTCNVINIWFWEKSFLTSEGMQLPLPHAPSPHPVYSHGCGWSKLALWTLLQICLSEILLSISFCFLPCFIISSNFFGLLTPCGYRGWSAVSLHLHFSISLDLPVIPYMSNKKSERHSTAYSL